MTETPRSQAPETQPNFMFGGKRVISEENWAEHEAQGVRNVVDSVPKDDEVALREELSLNGHFYGPENILLGDAFDKETSRPLRLKPGVGVYVTSEGREHFGRHFDKSSRRSPPVMILPDGTAIVARRGVRKTTGRPRHGAHTDAE